MEDKSDCDTQMAKSARAYKGILGCIQTLSLSHFLRALDNSLAPTIWIPGLMVPCRQSAQSWLDIIQQSLAYIGGTNAADECKNRRQ